MSRKPKAPGARPTKEQILDYLRAHPGRGGKREIARALGISGDDRIWLKDMLRELEGSGRIERGHGRRLAPAGTLPEFLPLDVFDTDMDGDLLAHPVQWPGPGNPPVVTLVPTGDDLGKVGIGDRVLARVRRIGGKSYEGRVVRLLQAKAEDVVGIYSTLPGAEGIEGRIAPADRKRREDFLVKPEHANGARDGDFVIAELLPASGRGLTHARVTERIGQAGDPRTLSLIAIAEHDIPTRFTQEALDEAEAAQPVTPAGRDDLTKIPLLTIDPADARDRDDAVWAEADEDPGNPGGWHLLVAIADVAHYVRPGNALDREARNRGNSCYFPDRVVPMLPERLSAGLCSLAPDEPRACLAVHMWIDRDGHKRRHRFVRGLMRSRAALEYGQVQRAVDGQPDEKTGPLLPLLRPLYGAYAALSAARDAREPLAIDLPERRVHLGKDGFIAAIKPYERFDSHKLIEEFMVLANVAAAETLEDVRQPCMYRVHDAPSMDKMEALRQFLETLDFSLPKGQTVRPRQFNRVLERVAGTPQQEMINQVILRSQMQAIYSGENRGHFGLTLKRYAHFTSPIRRYSDLLVHRALISGLGLGRDGLSAEDAERFDDTAEHISRTERRAMAAERDAVDRFTTVFLADRVGAEFAGRISGVTRFGLFVSLAETGADGLIPIASIGDDYYEHDAARHTLAGRSRGRTFRLGDRVIIRLHEANTITGSMVFQLVRDLDETESRPRQQRGRGRGFSRPPIPRGRRGR